MDRAKKLNRHVYFIAQLLFVLLTSVGCLRNGLWGRAGSVQAPVSPPAGVVQPIPQINFKTNDYVLTVSKIDATLKNVITNDYTPTSWETQSLVRSSTNVDPYYFIAIHLTDPSQSFVVQLPDHLTPLNNFMGPNIANGETQEIVYKSFTDSLTNEVKLLKFKIENRTAEVTTVHQAAGVTYSYFMQIGSQKYAVTGVGFDITFTNLETLAEIHMPANRRFLNWKPFPDTHLLVAETFGPGFELQITVYDENLNQILYKEFGPHFSNIASTSDEKEILFRSFISDTSTHYKLQFGVNPLNPSETVLEATPFFTIHTTSRFPGCAANDLSICIFEINDGSYKYKIYNTLTSELLCEASISGAMAISLAVDQTSATLSINPAGDIYRVYSLETCEYKTTSSGKLNFPISSNHFLEIDQTGSQLSFNTYDNSDQLLSAYSAPESTFSSLGVTLQDVGAVSLVKLSPQKVYLKFNLYRGWEEASLEAFYDIQTHTITPVTQPIWVPMYF